MRRWLKWVLVLLLLITLLATVSGWIVHRRMTAKPTWYARPALDAAAQRNAARLADSKLIDTFTAARDAQARETVARYAGANAPPATAPAEPITLVLTEEEMNAFFGKWADAFGWKKMFGAYMADPQVILDGTDLILAADVKGQWNTVMSLHFEPRLENAKVNMGLSSVMAGTMSVPRSWVGGYQKQLEGMVEKNLPDLRTKAKIAPEGWANKPAVDAAMSELLVHTLRGEPAEPVLFFPDMTKPSRYLPMKVIGVEIVDQALKLTVQPMTPAERVELLKHLKGVEEKGQ